MELGMVYDMEMETKWPTLRWTMDMVANVEVGMMADIDMEIRFDERVGHWGCLISNFFDP